MDTYFENIVKWNKKYPQDKSNLYQALHETALSRHLISYPNKMIYEIFQFDKSTSAVLFIEKMYFVI